MKNPRNPSFAEIESLFRRNIYKDENTFITLDIKYDENQQFQINLNVETSNSYFKIDTRIALERHELGHIHDKTHLQLDIQKKESDFFKNGVIHISLLVDTTEELDECSKGFTYILTKILDKINEELNLKKISLKDYFFVNNIDQLESSSNELFLQIEKSFEKDKIYIKNNEPIVEIKNKKSDDFSLLSEHKKIFFFLRLLNEIPIYSPLLKIPVYNRFMKLPGITNLNLTIDEHERNINILIEKSQKIEQFTPRKFLVEYEKLFK